LNSSLLKTIEDQIIFGFTGKINIMARERGQLLGCALLFEGHLINVKYKGCDGHKAFYNACIESFNINPRLVLEPEMVNGKDRKIDTPFSALKTKLIEVQAEYEAIKDSRPPKNISLTINPSFLSGNTQVSSHGFSLLCTLVDHSAVDDIYKHNSLLDFQITNALIELRQKKAIKVAVQKG